MGQQCKVCNHPEARDIESQVLRGVSGNTLAKKYGMSQASIWRHTHSCVAVRALRKSEPIPKSARFDTVQMLTEVANTLLRVSMSAESKEREMTVVQAQGKLADVVMKLHEMQPKEESQPIHRHPEFAAWRARLVAALEPHPEAQQAVIRALTAGKD